MMRDDFAVLIFSHGRSQNVSTVKMLNRYKYSGKWYIVIDNEDDTADDYYKEYGDHVIMFDKAPVIADTDTMDIENEHRAIVYARNKSFDIAKDLGLTYFQQLDDDCRTFGIRKQDGRILRRIDCPSYDAIVYAMIEFLDTSGALTVAFVRRGIL